MYCLKALEARSPGSRCQQGWFLPRTVGSVAGLSLSFRWFAGSLWPSLVCWKHHPDLCRHPHMCSCARVCPNFHFFVRTAVLGLGAHPALAGPHVNCQVVSAVTLFPGNSTFFRAVRCCLRESWGLELQQMNLRGYDSTHNTHAVQSSAFHSTAAKKVLSCCPTSERRAKVETGANTEMLAASARKLTFSKRRRARSLLKAVWLNKGK